MKIKPLLGNRLLLLRRIPQRRRRLVEGVVVQRRDGAEGEGGEIEEARGQDLRLARRGESRRTLGEIRHQSVDHQAVLQAAPPLVQPEPLLLRRRFDGRDAEILEGRGRNGILRLLGGIGGASEHLNHLLETGGIGLNESGGVGIGIRSGESLGRERRRGNLGTIVTVTAAHSTVVADVVAAAHIAFWRINTR